jgi:hypothetical protein
MSGPKIRAAQVVVEPPNNAASWLLCISHQRRKQPWRVIVPTGLAVV